MERPIDYDFHEFRKKKKEDPEGQEERRGGIGNVFLIQLVIGLVTAILLLFANVLFPDALKEAKNFYETQVKGDLGITQDISNVFQDVTDFLTASSGDSASGASSSPENSSGSGSSSSNSDDDESGSSVSSTVGLESSNPSSASAMAMGMGGEENPLPLSRESAGLAAPDTEPLKTDYVIPIHGKISSGYGYRLHPITGLPDFHKGIDIPADEGTEISAFRSGTVIQAQSSVSFGNFVAIQHENGVITRYGHCSRLNVKVGDMVEAGDVIGFVGNTGYSTGSHCHFDISVNGVFVNPLKVIPSHQEAGYVAV